jgi:cytoskeletal protein CcmA (bactofilin family)
MSASKILSGIKIEGKLSGTSDIKVEGEIDGEINLESSIYIAEGGKAKANIKAVNVFIAGEFEGDIDADFVQISPTGKGKGALKAPAVSIEKGAKFSGQLQMGEGDANGPIGMTAEEISASADEEDVSTPAEDEPESSAAEEKEEDETDADADEESTDTEK